MDGLVIGLDIRDNYTKLSLYETDRSWTFSTSICKKKACPEWYVGEEGFGYALDGMGIMVDKLLTQVEKDGTATIEGVRYEGQELMRRYVEKLLQLPVQELGIDRIAQLVITIPKLSKKIIEKLRQSACVLGLTEKQVHVISHGESFVYYLLSQKKEVWSNQVAMFDLSDEELCYHEMKVQRGLKKPAVLEESVNLDEGFNLKILEAPAGVKLADKILSSCAERLLQRKLYSAILLTGKGFESQDWAVNFMKIVCSKRKVYVDFDVYSKGAAYRAADYLQEKTSYPFVIACEGRIQSTVSMTVEYKERELQIVLAAAGDNWYETKAETDFILDQKREVEFRITSLDTKKSKLVKIPLDGFPERPDRTTRVQVQVSFTDGKTMWVSIRDKGFGELFPAEDVSVIQEIIL